MPQFRLSPLLVLPRAACARPHPGEQSQGVADVGITWFRPDRGVEISGNGADLNGSYDGNDRHNFLISELGYLHPLTPRWTAGVAGDWQRIKYSDVSSVGSP